MFTKVTTVLLIASVAFAAHVSFSENVGTKIDDDLAKFKNVINAVIDGASHQFIQVLDGYNHTAIEVESTTNSALKTLGEGNQKELGALKAKAGAAHVNIDECLGKDEKALLDLPKAFGKADFRCVKVHEFKILTEANVTFFTILQVKKEFSEIGEEIGKCGGNGECLQKLDERIEIETTEIPKRIEGQVKDFTTYITTIATDDLKKCEPETLKRADAAGKALLLKITTCVNGKLKN